MSSELRWPLKWKPDVLLSLCFQLANLTAYDENLLESV